MVGFIDNSGSSLPPLPDPKRVGQISNEQKRRRKNTRNNKNNVSHMSRTSPNSRNNNNHRTTNEDYVRKSQSLPPKKKTVTSNPSVSSTQRQQPVKKTAKKAVKKSSSSRMTSPLVPMSQKPRTDKNWENKKVKLQVPKPQESSKKIVRQQENKPDENSRIGASSKEKAVNKSNYAGPNNAKTLSQSHSVSDKTDAKFQDSRKRLADIVEVSHDKPLVPTEKKEEKESRKAKKARLKKEKAIQKAKREKEREERVLAEKAKREERLRLAREEEEKLRLEREKEELEESNKDIHNEDSDDKEDELVIEDAKDANEIGSNVKTMVPIPVGTVSETIKNGKEGVKPFRVFMTTWFVLLVIGASIIGSWGYTVIKDASIGKERDIAYQAGYNDASDIATVDSVVRVPENDLSRMIIEAPGASFPANPILSRYTLDGWTIPGGNENHGRAQLSMCYTGDGITGHKKASAFLVTDNANAEIPNWSVDSVSVTGDNCSIEEGKK